MLLCYQDQRQKRKLMSESHFVAVFGKRTATAEEINEEFNRLSAPQVLKLCGLACSCSHNSLLFIYNRHQT